MTTIHASCAPVCSCCVLHGPRRYQDNKSLYMWECLLPVFVCVLHALRQCQHNIIHSAGVLVFIFIFHFTRFEAIPAYGVWVVASTHIYICHAWSRYHHAKHTQTHDVAVNTVWSFSVRALNAADLLYEEVNVLRINNEARGLTSRRLICSFATCNRIDWPEDWQIKGLGLNLQGVV